MPPVACRASWSSRWRTELGFDEAEPPGPASGAEARDRHAALVHAARDGPSLEADRPDATVADFLDELARRDEAEADAAGDGVTLSTLHRAKGLEWDAVFLPQLEEGTLPIRQASDPTALAEERRLLYVGHHPGAAPPHAVLGAAACRLEGDLPHPAVPVPPGAAAGLRRRAAAKPRACPGDLRAVRRRRAAARTADRVAAGASASRRRPGLRRRRQQDARRDRHPAAGGRGGAPCRAGHRPAQGRELRRGDPGDRQVGVAPRTTSMVSTMPPGAKKLSSRSASSAREASGTLGSWSTLRALTPMSSSTRSWRK